MQTFEKLDQILPMLELPNPCPIKVVIRKDFLRLYIGPRDWQWRLSDGSFIGAGTRSDHPDEEDGEEEAKP